MSTVQREARGSGYPSHAEPDVVAGLVNDGSAAGVARAAVQEAVRLGASVRFIQVIPEGTDEDDLAEADSATFGAALQALRGHPRTASTFELVQGDPQQVLVERSRRAIVLFVGADQSTSDASVADYCRRHASCAVETVSRDH